MRILISGGGVRYFKPLGKSRWHRYRYFFHAPRARDKDHWRQDLRVSEDMYL
jgi:hypothetical protein